MSPTGCEIDDCGTEVSVAKRCMACRRSEIFCSCGRDGYSPTLETERCDACGRAMCHFHRRLGPRSPRFASPDDFWAFRRSLREFLQPRVYLSEDPHDADRHQFPTHREFSTNLRTRLSIPSCADDWRDLCAPCLASALEDEARIFEEQAMLPIRNAIAAGVICGVHQWCLGDPIINCAKCSVSACRRHSAQCSICGKRLCASYVSERPTGSYPGGGCAGGHKEKHVLRGPPSMIPLWPK